MSEKKHKAGIKELSPIDVYKLLPKTNCKECGEANCMAFATKIVNREVSIDQCPPLLEKENATLILFCVIQFVNNKRSMNSK